MSEKFIFTKEFKYDLNRYLAKLPLQETQRAAITELVSTMINSSNSKMEKQVYTIIDKKVEKFWKIVSGIIIAVIAGVILYGILPVK